MLPLFLLNFPGNGNIHILFTENGRKRQDGYRIWEIRVMCT